MTHESVNGSGTFHQVEGGIGEVPFVVLLLSIYVLYVKTISCYMSFYLVVD